MPPPPPPEAAGRSSHNSVRKDWSDTEEVGYDYLKVEVFHWPQVVILYLVKLRPSAVANLSVVAAASVVVDLEGLLWANASKISSVIQAMNQGR